jgi:hypothetical protein
MHECMGTHDVVHDTFVAIVQNVSFHVGWKQLHTLSSSMFNSSRQWVNIVLTKDGICTLANVVIDDSMRTDLFPWSCIIQIFFSSNAIQAKEMSNCD